VPEWANLVPSAVARVAGKLVSVWPPGPVVHWPPKDAFSDDSDVAALVDSLAEDGSRALAQLKMPATPADIVRVWNSLAT